MDADKLLYLIKVDKFIVDRMETSDRRLI